jgi:hypothetical protein
MKYRDLVEYGSSSLVNIPHLDDNISINSLLAVVGIMAAISSIVEALWVLESLSRLAMIFIP